MKLKILLTSLLAFLITGCVSTRPLGDATRLPEAQRVTIIVQGPHISLYKVDSDHRGYGIVDSFQISPGLHTITFSGSLPHGVNSVMSVDAKYSYSFEEGQTYVVADAPEGSPAVVRIINQKSGQELAPRAGL